MSEASLSSLASLPLEDTRHVGGHVPTFRSQRSGVGIRRTWGCGIAMACMVAGLVCIIWLPHGLGDTMSGSDRPLQLVGSTSSAFLRYTKMSCWEGFGGEQLQGGRGPAVVSLDACREACAQASRCAAFAFPSGITEAGLCALQQRINLQECVESPSVDIWMKISSSSAAQSRQALLVPEPPLAEVPVEVEAAFLVRACNTQTLSGYRCDAGPVQLRGSPQDCRTACTEDAMCFGVSIDVVRGFCHFLRKRLHISACSLDTSWEVWLNPQPPVPWCSNKDEAAHELEEHERDELDIHERDEPPPWDMVIRKRKLLSADDDFRALPGYDCRPGRASQGVSGRAGPVVVADTTACLRTCAQESACEGVVFRQASLGGDCWLRRRLDIEACVRRPQMPGAPQWESYVKATRTIETSTAVSAAPLHVFYLYTVSDVQSKQPEGDFNAGDVHVVVSQLAFGAHMQNASIHRFKVRARATTDLFGEGRHFGPGFVYDNGRCEGRCRCGRCSGPGDCDARYRKYGFVPGCGAMPERPEQCDDGAAPKRRSGLRFSLPAQGRCSGDPTGDKHCTWSLEASGHLTIEELQGAVIGASSAADASRALRREPRSLAANAWRAGAILWAFANKYPSETDNLLTPNCHADWRPEEAGNATPAW